MSTSPSRIIIKATFGPITKHLALHTPTLSFADLCSAIHSLFRTSPLLSPSSSNLILRYIDADGDAITLDSDSDLSLALDLSTSSSHPATIRLRLMVFDKVNLPDSVQLSSDLLHTNGLSLVGRNVVALHTALSDVQSRLDRVLNALAAAKDKDKNVRPLNSDDIANLLGATRISPVTGPSATANPHSLTDTTTPVAPSDSLSPEVKSSVTPTPISPAHQPASVPSTTQQQQSQQSQQQQLYHPTSTATSASTDPRPPTSTALYHPLSTSVASSYPADPRSASGYPVYPGTGAGSASTGGYPTHSPYGAANGSHATANTSQYHVPQQQQQQQQQQHSATSGGYSGQQSTPASTYPPTSTNGTIGMPYSGRYPVQPQSSGNVVTSGSVPTQYTGQPSSQHHQQPRPIGYPGYSIPAAGGSGAAGYPPAYGYPTQGQGAQQSHQQPPQQGYQGVPTAQLYGKF